MHHRPGPAHHRSLTSPSVVPDSGRASADCQISDVGRCSRSLREGNDLRGRLWPILLLRTSHAASWSHGSARSVPPSRCLYRQRPMATPFRIERDIGGSSTLLLRRRDYQAGRTSKVAIGAECYRFAASGFGSGIDRIIAASSRTETPTAFARATRSMMCCLRSI